MKIYLDNGISYDVQNVADFQTTVNHILRTHKDELLKDFSLDTATDFEDYFKFFNIDGDEITDAVVHSTDGSRPPVKAVYVSSGSAELWSKVASYVPSFNVCKTDHIVDGGLYVWVKDHEVWDYIDSVNLGAYKYIAQSYDCVVNALHHLNTVDHTDALGQADAAIADYRATHSLS